MSTKQQSHYPARWSKFFSRFNFVIWYWPKKLGVNLNKLTRRWKNFFKKGDKRLRQIVQTVLEPHNLDFVVKKHLVTALLLMEETQNVKNNENFTLEELINRSYHENFLPSRVLELLVNGANFYKDFTITDCAIVHSRLYYWNCFYLFISIVCITISLIQAIQELIIPMNSSTGTIIGPTCKIFSRNTFGTATYASITKDFDFRSKESFGLYWFLIKDGQTLVSILSPTYFW